MRLQVTVQVYDDLLPETPVVWGYMHEEQIPQEAAQDVDYGAVMRGERGPTDDELRRVEEVTNKNSSTILDEALLRIDESRESIIRQAAAGLPDRSQEK